MTPGEDSDVLDRGFQVQKWLDDFFALRFWAYIDGAERNDILGWSISPRIRDTEEGFLIMRDHLLPSQRHRRRWW